MGYSQRFILSGGSGARQMYKLPSSGGVQCTGERSKVNVLLSSRVYIQVALYYCEKRSSDDRQLIMRK